MKNLLLFSCLSALTLLLVSCDLSMPQPKATPTPTPAATPEATATPEPAEPTASTESKELSLFVWSQYVPPEVLDAFFTETGIEVDVTTYSSNEEMLAKLLAEGGEYDLIQPSDYTVEALVGAGLLEKLDQQRIPNLRNVDPVFLDRSFDPGNQYTVPYMAGLVGIVYNSEKISAEIDGFEDVFRPEHAGRIVVIDDPRQMVSWALAAKGLPINDVSDANLAKVRPLLAQWLPLVNLFDSDSPRLALLNGEADIGIVWNGEAAKLLEESEKFRWIVPEQGAHLFIDSLAIPKGAEHPQNAMAFMNFILRPEISKMLSDAYPYLNPNLAARELLTEAQRSNPASFPPPQIVQGLETFEDIGEQSSEVDEMITTLKVQ